MGPEPPVRHPRAFVVGAVGGYRWVASGPGATTQAAHFPPEIVVLLALEGDPLGVGYVVVPTAFGVAVLVGASLLAYRVGPARFRRLRKRLVPTGREG